MKTNIRHIILLLLCLMMLSVSAQEHQVVVQASECAAAQTYSMPDGASLILKATPADDSRFVSWSDGNTDNPRTVTITGDASFTACFAHNGDLSSVDKYQVTIYAGACVNPFVGEFSHGALLKIVPDPMAGYQFKQWSDGNTDNPRFISVTSNIELHAEFETLVSHETLYDVMVIADGCSTSFNHQFYGGTPLVLDATPEEGYVFVKWSDDNTYNPRNVTVTSDITYTAIFAKQKFPISFVNYDGSPLQSGEVEYGAIPAYNGETPTKPADAQYTYTFSGWDAEIVAVTGEATYTAQFTSTAIITGPIVIGDGESKDLSDLDPAGTQFIEEIIVEPGGELNVDDANIHIGKLVVVTDGTNSGQVHHGADGINADHIYLEYILNPCGEFASPNRWYAISVPFEVDIATGISRNCDDKTLVSGTDFLIKEYNGTWRALLGHGWSSKLEGSLNAGQFYMIGIDGTCNRWRFEQKAGQPFEGDTHVGYDEYASSNPLDKGWNGLGNTMLEHMRLNMGLSGINYMVTYDNCYGRFVTHLIADIHLCVGRPFFIQASSDGFFDFFFGNTLNNMPALYAQHDAKPLMHFTLSDETQSTGIDHMYLTMHEDATADYTIGRDVARMSTSCTTAAQLWTTMPDGTQLSAHGIEIPATSTTVSLELFAPAAGEYLFAMSSRAMEGYDVELLHNGAWVATFYDAQPVTLDLSAGTNSGYVLRISRRNIPTGIEDVQGDNVQSTKVIMNDHLYILRAGHIYDAQGKKVK